MNVTAPTTTQTSQVGMGSAPTPTKQEEPIVHLRTSEKSRAAQKEIAKSFNGIDSGSVLSSAYWSRQSISTGVPGAKQRSRNDTRR